MENFDELEALRERIRMLEERQAELLALRQLTPASDTRLRLITDYSTDMITFLTPEGRFLYVSQGAESVLGYTPEELQLLGRYLFEFLCPDETERAQEAYQELLKEPGVRTLTCRMVRQNGVEVWVESVNETVVDERTGAVSKIIAISRDVTQRKQVEEHLRRLEARHRALLNAIPDLIFVNNADGVFLDFSARPGTELRIPSHQIVGSHLRDALPERVVNQALDSIHATLETGETRVFEYPLPVDGEIEYFEARTVRVSPAEALTIVRRITERRRAEHRLRESQQKLRLLVDQSPLAVIGWDLEFQVTEWNPAAERTFGYRKSELLGRRGTEVLVPVELHGAVEAVFSELVQRRGGYRSTNENVTKDGRTILCEWYNTPLVGENGEVVGVASLVQDVTERAQAEEARRRLEAQMLHTQKLESLGVLAGGIAHDFNNLLVGVMGNAGLALMEMPADSPARPAVQAIEQAAVRAADLTRQMLAYSGKGKFLIQNVNLSHLVGEMSHLIMVSISKTAIVNEELAGDLPAVEADATQLQQVVMNLIINASDALEQRPGTITVRTGTMQASRDYLAEAFLAEKLEPGTYVYLEVADTGHGMDAETRSRIFDPFFTTKTTGRGLGLAAVLGIVRSHHGTIRVTTAAGAGTAFRVLLPPAKNQSAPPPPQVEAPPAKPITGTVLVVDDDETVRGVARSILVRHGYKVIMAYDGVEGVERFKENPDGIDLVLLDMTMPRMSGEETFAVLRKIRPGVRVLLTSGYNEQEAVARFISEGLSGFVQKPFRVRELLEKVAQAINATAGGNL